MVEAAKWSSNLLENRRFGLSGYAHLMLHLQQALRTLRGRNPFASLQTGPTVFSGTGIACFPGNRPCGVCGPQLFCVLANRPFGFFGHGHRMLPRQQALRCLRGRKSIVSLQTGPSVFSGMGIACFPGNRPCGVGGPSIQLRPC